MPWLSDKIFKKIMYWISIAALLVFLLISGCYTVHYSWWFLLGAIPFLMAVLVTDISGRQQQFVYFLDYSGCGVSIIFTIIYLGMLFDTYFAATADALSDVGWIFIIPVHFAAYVIVSVIAWFIYYLSNLMFWANK